jgi:sarcosine oxidase subunit delta
VLILTCPHCGLACDETELAPGGEAHLRRFGPDSSDEEFLGYMFHRQNPKGRHFERWRHVYGCGKWFLAARDTVTLRVFGTYPAWLAAPPPELSGDGLCGDELCGRAATPAADAQPGAPAPAPEAAP